MNRVDLLTKPLIALYVTGINVGSFGLFYYDKQQAVNRGWRVPEKTLQLTALMGGWLGGMLAIDTFRHKTKKEPFRTLYQACIAANISGVAALAYLAKRKPTVMSKRVQNYSKKPNVNNKKRYVQ